MTDFLIKSTIAMGILLGLYYILFEREKMHRFNRFYLLGALVFSLALPFITVITYVQEIPQANTIIETSQLVMSPEVTYSAAKGTIYKPITNYIPYLAWIIYGTITFLLAIRFIKNVLSFFRKAKDNPTINIEGAKLVLLNEKVLPHTFLNYIFINREEYETNSIENELYTHELTHVKQKHTLDILFIEALKTIFWFNPLLYFYKRAIQLNHEFLADEKVIDTTANTIYYQNLLLEKANVGTTFSMASNLTFSLTKKRFIMMTKTTSSVKASLLKLAIAPVIIVMMLLLCTETIAQETKSKIDPDTQERINKMIVPDKVMDSLKKANPDMFSDDLSIRYKNTKFTFIDKNGKETVVKGYKSLNEKQKKQVSHAPEIYGMDLTISEPVETTPTVKAPATKKQVLKKKLSATEPQSKKIKPLNLQIKDGMEGIASDKIKSINIYKQPIHQQQVDSLKQVKPEVYVSNNPENYSTLNIEYSEDNGKILRKKIFIESETK